MTARVLAVMAHPDDIEMTCAGTLALLKRAGWHVHMASMSAGDLGSATLSRAEISRIRRKEAAASAKLLGAGYTCLEFDDLTIVYNETTKRRVSALLRQVRPDRARDFRNRRVKYAEGFRPHLGHGFPRHDYLTTALGARLVKALSVT